LSFAFLNNLVNIFCIKDEYLLSRYNLENFTKWEVKRLYLLGIQQSVKNDY
jgi:hypothetical protein